MTFNSVEEVIKYYVGKPNNPLNGLTIKEIIEKYVKAN